MKTFRGLLKSKLIELGYPVEISKFYANGRGIRNLGRWRISKSGIKIVRDIYPEYTDRRSGRYYEDICIYRNNFINENKLNEIITELKINYGNSKLLNIYIYD